MKVLRFYVETSVWNFLAKEREEINTPTRRFFEEVRTKQNKIFVSPLVILEIEQTQEADILQSLQTVIQKQRPEILVENAEIFTLAEKYIQAGIIPERYRNDALHISYATLYEMDAIVSWNLKHIVKMKTRQLVNHVNLLNGYRNVELATPEEALENE